MELDEDLGGLSDRTYKHSTDSLTVPSTKYSWGLLITRYPGRLSARELRISSEKGVRKSSFAPGACLLLGGTSSSYDGRGSMTFWAEYPESAKVSTQPTIRDLRPYLELDVCQQLENSLEHFLERTLRRSMVGRRAHDWKNSL